MKAFAAAVALAAAWVLPATAQDKSFEAGKPEAVAAALREAGYKAVMKTSKEGKPYIESAANGDPFTVRFYGCGAIDCGSFQFFSWYKKDPLFTVDFVNQWNKEYRFLRTVIDDDGDLSTYLDVAVKGPMTQAAFADWVDWYQVMDVALDKFIAEKRAAARPVPSAK